MLPNLQAEQARYKMTNQSVADHLGISRVAYEGKKKSRKFTADECTALCKLFHCDFNYLFARDPIPHNQAS